MVKRSEIGIWGTALCRSQGFPAEPEVLGLSSRVRRAASSLQMQSEETVLDSYGPTKTAILTMLQPPMMICPAYVHVIVAACPAASSPRAQM